MSLIIMEGGDRMRILLAEDEKRMAAALVAILRQEKYIPIVWKAPARSP